MYIISGRGRKSGGACATEATAIVWRHWRFTRNTCKDIGAKKNLSSFLVLKMMHWPK